MKLPMFENSRGRRDYLLTASVLTLAVVLVKLLVGGMVLFGHQLGPPPDAATTLALLGATLGAYTTKRVTVDKDRQGGAP